MRHTTKNGWRSESAMTPAVSAVLTRKYPKAETATPIKVAAMSPRSGAKRRNSSPATKAEVASDPALKAALTSGLRVGVKALTPAWISATSTPTPLPYST